jgi:hypothetical protein
MAYVLKNPEQDEWFGVCDSLGAWLVVKPECAPRAESGGICHLPIEVDPYWDIDERVKRGLMCDDCCRKGIDATIIDPEDSDFPAS